MSMTSAAEVRTQAVSPELMALGAAFTRLSPSFHAATKRPVSVRRDEAYVAGAAESVAAELPSGNAPVARRFPLRTVAKWKRTDGTGPTKQPGETYSRRRAFAAASAAATRRGAVPPMTSQLAS